MEKLIELLNEYDGHNHWWDYEEEDLDINKEENSVLEIISKQFWFIKWLVEQDKIDRDNLQDGFRWYIEKVYYRQNEINCTETYTKYEALLMLLSIQDEPIEFLISILK